MGTFLNVLSLRSIAEKVQPEPVDSLIKGALEGFFDLWDAHVGSSSKTFQRNQLSNIAVCLEGLSYLTVRSAWICLKL
jgi:hypothetical protein